MLLVILLCGAPSIMPGSKGIFWTDDFAFEKCSQCRVLRGQAWKGQRLMATYAGRSLPSIFR